MSYDAMKKHWERLSFEDVNVTKMRIRLDGEEKHLTMYEGVYVKNPTKVSMVPDDGVDQRFSLYVPDNADHASPIVFFVKNWGWKANSYKNRHKVEEDKDYKANDPNDLIGKLMADGYVLLTYGCRGRGDFPNEEGQYISHSPATMTDTKALIRYIRHNRALLPAGDPDHVIITGTSGGGALSTIIGASGNSEEFYPSLYEIGAAGMEKAGDSYVSTERDDVFAVIAYCPINDLREGDAAYEYTYGNVRRRLIEEGLPVVNPVSGLTFQDPFTDIYTPEWMLEAGKALAKQYGEYVTGLSLTDEGGDAITGENLREKMRILLNAGFKRAYSEFGWKKMKEDLAGGAEYGGRKTAEMFHEGSEGWTELFARTEDGTPYLADEKALEDYLYFVARNQTLKGVCAFSNRGLAENGLASVSKFNEDDLYGTREQAYCPFEFWSWDHDAVKGNKAGLDDTGLTFEEYLKTEEGKELTAQLNMSSPIHYLVKTEGASSDVCHHWYVRHGLRDRDTGFALQTVLYHALRNNEAVLDLNFLFPWLKPHCGDYDVLEAYAWLRSVME